VPCFRHHVNELDGMCAVPFLRWDAEADYIVGKALGAQQVASVDPCRILSYGTTSSSASPSASRCKYVRSSVF